MLFLHRIAINLEKSITMDQNDDDDVDKVEPPAGLQFTNIIPSTFSIIDKSECSGYKILETAPAQEVYNKVDRIKRSGIPRRHSYFSIESTARKLRTLSNSAVGDQLQKFFERYPKAKEYVDLVDSKKRSALHIAASRGADDLVHLLLQQGANPNVQDCNGNTPLHLAACTHHIRVVTLLLRFGADVKKVDIAGKTPLHLSMSRLKRLSDENKNLDKRKKLSSYTTEKRKAEVLEIISMLTEYFDKCGQKDDYFKMCDMKTQLLAVDTGEGVSCKKNLMEKFVPNF